MKQKLSLVVVTILTIAIGLIFISRTLKLEGAAIIDAIAKFQPIYWLTALTMAIIQSFFQMHRLWVLFPKEARIGWMRVARAFAYGQFINTFGPSGAGDLLKVVLTRKNKDEKGRQVEAAEATAIVLVADKVVDVGSVFFLIFIALFQTSFTLPDLHWRTRVKTILLSATLLFILIYILVLILRSRSPVIARWLKGFKTGLQALQEPRRLSGGLFMGAGNWLSELASLQILCIAQGFPLSYPELILALVILNVGLSIPISLANLGVFEASLAFALTQFEIPLAESLAIATAHHLCQMGEITLWTLSFWIYDRSKDWKRG
jgi:glycosyltransferase 2 family protein